MPHLAAYAAGKFALTGLSETLRAAASNITRSKPRVLTRRAMMAARATLICEELCQTVSKLRSSAVGGLREARDRFSD